MHSIIKRANPVGFARPPISPNNPGLLVKSHSVVVKFLAFVSGSFTTTRPVILIDRLIVVNQSMTVIYRFRVINQTLSIMSTELLLTEIAYMHYSM